MKKKLLATLIVISLILGMTACKSATEDSPSEQDIDAITEKILAEKTDEEKNWMGGLKRSERLGDFTALCDGLRENYPYLELAKRTVGADIDELEKAYQEKIINCTNDDEFYNILKDFIGEFAYTGHLELWGRRYESQLTQLQSLSENDIKTAEKFAPYIEVLDNPTSHKTYQAMETFYSDVDHQVQEAMKENDSTPQNEVWDDTDTGTNVETKIIEEGKIAYISIDAFDAEQMDHDREILMPFYEEIYDYENLIIDITQNLGGSMNYFNDLVVAPLTKELRNVPTYQLLKGGENNRTFLNLDKGITSGFYQPIEKLPDLPNLNEQDIKDCDYFLQENYSVEPTGKGFDGKIWLLVSENNYSSSEYAAMFSKASGFATLVGETTSGDGIGTDPVYLILPNSGLVVQYSPMYGVTSDGTGSEEFGTDPDIFSPKDENELDTCLKQIAE